MNNKKEKHSDVDVDFHAERLAEVMYPHYMDESKKRHAKEALVDFIIFLLSQIKQP